jgi:hypothetical protein
MNKYKSRIKHLDFAKSVKQNRMYDAANLHIFFDLPLILYTKFRFYLYKIGIINLS